MKKFEVGKTYEQRSICDHNCIWRFTVIARTACTITLQDERGEVKKCRVIKDLSSMYNAEHVYPLGRYSMAPSLHA